MKKIWEKPELLVLMRNRPEESVLEHCKTESGGRGPDTTAHSCDRVVNKNCGVCHSRGGTGS